MRQTADAIVVGGGVMGCSILYGLTQLGVTNTLLPEQDAPGSGSTGRSRTRGHFEALSRHYW